MLIGLDIGPQRNYYLIFHTYLVRLWIQDVGRRVKIQFIHYYDCFITK